MVSVIPSLIEVTHEGAVAELRFNRPEALNVIDVAMAQAFKAQVEQLVRRPELRVLIIAGAGRAFMAGGDLKAFARIPAEERARLSWQIINPVHDALVALAESPLLTIAAVHGAIAGAGMSIALGTDLAIASAEATFNFAYAKVAVSPDCGGSYWLPRIVGWRRALEIALLAETVSAETAQQWGLINRVTGSEEDLQALARSMAERLSVGPARAYAATRRLLRQSGAHSLREQLDRERDSFVALSAEAEFNVALERFFSAKAAKSKRSGE
jgi:2-(1,2-epoxy-1,2-dihydrophenyl)acetyl-CoA isomerase